MKRKLKATALLLTLIMCFNTILPVFAAPLPSEFDLILWDEDNYTIWENKNSAHLTNIKRDTHLHSESCHHEKLYSIVFTTQKDYKEWLLTLDEDIKRHMESVSYEVLGKNLPNSIIGIQSNNNTDNRNSKAEAISIDKDATYIIVPRAVTICAICGFLLGALAGWVLGRFVFDPAFDWLMLEIEKYGECANNHTQLLYTDTINTSCPYINWCGGTWARVVSDHGSYAECECECGALWNKSYN
jgi:hypothetical protein